MRCCPISIRPAPPGLVTLPGAFVGVLLATGSAAQAGAVQVLVLISLLLSQACGVAVTGELVARGWIVRTDLSVPTAPCWKRRLHRRRTSAAS